MRVRYDERDNYKTITSTVAEYFAIEKKIDPRVKEYTDDLKEIFPDSSTKSHHLSRADLFIQHYSKYLEEELVTWIAKADRRDVIKYLRELQTLCALNNLHVHPDETTEKLVEIVIVSTYYLLKRLKIIK